MERCGREWDGQAEGWLAGEAFLYIVAVVKCEYDEIQNGSLQMLMLGAWRWEIPELELC